MMLTKPQPVHVQARDKAGKSITLTLYGTTPQEVISFLRDQVMRLNPSSPEAQSMQDHTAGAA